MEREKFFRKNRKKLTLFLSVALVFLSVGFLLFFHFSQAERKKDSDDLILGLVADIHAGNKANRNYGNGNDLRPRDFCVNLEKVFAQSKADFFVALGDITLAGGGMEASMVKDCVDKFKKEFIWVMGNHDDARTWQALGMPSERYYYAVEKENWKIIVLYDSKYDARTKGGIDEEQLAWLESELQTEKKVVIAQHHPLYDRYGAHLVAGTNFDKEEEIIKRYSNVKYVLAGHTHQDHFCVNKGSFDFCRVRALSLKGFEGSFMDLKLE